MRDVGGKNQQQLDYFAFYSRDYVVLSNRDLELEVDEANNCRYVFEYTHAQYTYV